MERLLHFAVTACAFRRALAAFALCLALHSAAFAAGVVWPTESKDFQNGKRPEEFLQPTVSGNPLSGAFGDVRNNGYRFHEGIDIKPVRRNRKSEPLDEIYAAFDGVVRCVNRVAGNSGYGRYVVITHPQLDVEVYTLYAHMSAVDDGIVKGKRVRAGDRLGIMGRSASYAIAKPQAHLHFEIGLMYSGGFDRWYKNSRRFKQKNFFGNYNGMNLEGFDPLEFMYAARTGRVKSGMADYIKNMPTAYVARVYTSNTPDFARMYPALADGRQKAGKTAGWDIHFTWFGLPQKVERLVQSEVRAGAENGSVEVVRHDPKELTHKCRRAVILDSAGNVKATNELKDLIQKMFP